MDLRHKDSASSFLQLLSMQVAFAVGREKYEDEELHCLSSSPRPLPDPQTWPHHSLAGILRTDFPLDSPEAVQVRGPIASEQRGISGGSALRGFQRRFQCLPGKQT